jgi:L-2-amino-thiazoline-4-carboxylic acid hydrolase
MEIKISEIKHIRSALKDELGPSWPLFLAKCGLYSNTVFKKTRWASKRDEESKFAKRLSFAPAIYLKLCERFDKEKAYKLAEQMLLPTSVDDLADFVDPAGSTGKTAMERLMDFWNAYDTKGANRFMEKEVLQQDDSTYHYVMKRCVVCDFMQEAGTPELTRIFCDSDLEFLPRAFPELEFTRGDSPENTLGYGKDRCEYLFKKK